MSEQDQVAVCREHGREFTASPPDSKLGVTIQTLGHTPIHGLRHPPVGDTNGWYLWAGEYSADKDFFTPLHASHLAQRLPEVVRFLGLPPEAASYSRGSMSMFGSTSRCSTCSRVHHWHKIAITLRISLEGRTDSASLCYRLVSTVRIKCVMNEHWICSRNLVSRIGV